MWGVLQQRFEIGTSRRLVDPASIDDAYLEIVDLQELGNDKVDPRRQRELRMPTVVDPFEGRLHPPQRRGSERRTVPLIASIPLMQAHPSQYLDD